MESEQSKQSGSCSTNMYSPVELRDFNGKSHATGPDKYDTTKLVDVADVKSVLDSDMISSMLMHVKKEKLCLNSAEGNHQTSMRVLHDGLDKFKPLQLWSDEDTVLEILTSLKEGKSKVPKNIACFGDLVWGKIMSHPWWPGQIYNENLAPSPLRHTKKHGSVLVAFYGDYTYAWLNHDQIIPFEPHFEKKSKQIKSRTFTVAVKEAVCELKRRAVLGLTCFCKHPASIQPTKVEGHYTVDMRGYPPGAIYSSKQIEKSRDGFQPHAMFSFVKQLAMSPRSMPNVDRIINCAKVTAYRNAVYAENDETYVQAFEEFAKVNETYDQAFGLEASSSDDPVKFPKDNQLQVTNGAKALPEAPNGLGVLVASGDIAGLERNDSITLEQPCTDATSKSGPAALNHDHKGMTSEAAKALDNSESSQALDVPITVTEKTLQNPECLTLLFDASVLEDEEKSFKDKSDYSNVSCKREYKRKRREEFPPDDQGQKVKFQKDAIFDNLVAKSGEETAEKEKNHRVNDNATSENGDFFSGVEKFMKESFDEIRSFEGKPHQMSFQELPLQSNAEMRSLAKENSKCESDAEKQALPESNTNSKSRINDNQEVDVSSSVKISIGCENSQEGISEILCASRTDCSSIQYQDKVGSLNETVEVINTKYSMAEGWMTRYQQDLTDIGGSEFLNELTNLL